MEKVKRLIASLFGVGATEYAGFLWLMITLMVCSIGLFIADRITNKPYDNYEADAKMLDSLLIQMVDYKDTFKIELASFELFNFDPNTAHNQQLTRLGFPEWLSRQLINYRSKGGYFNSADDLHKLYNFPDTLFSRVAPYVKIERKVIKETKSKKKAPIHSYNPSLVPQKPITFDINIADTSMLQTIKGIGGVLSKRIVSYRDKLGGFWSYDQLYEVYYLDSAVVEELKKVAFIQRDFNPQKIEINVVNEKELASHPYVNYQQARLIIAYRNQHGNFVNRESLLEVYSINNGWLEKIDPYLSF